MYTEDAYLGKFKDDGTVVHAYLLSGIKLVGKIVAYDAENVQINNASSQQLVSKRNISTILPADYKPAVK